MQPLVRFQGVAHRGVCLQIAVNGRHGGLRKGIVTQRYGTRDEVAELRHVPVDTQAAVGVREKDVVILRGRSRGIVIAIAEGNVIITPHVAPLSDRIFQRMLEVVRENLRRYVAGEPMLSVVDPERGY